MSAFKEMVKEGYPILSCMNETYLPIKGSKDASCIDLKARLLGIDDSPVYIKFYDSSNQEGEIKVYKGLILKPGYRYKIPTGVFSYFINDTLYIYSRSGRSLKEGLVLISSPNIIDADYPNEIFMLMTNTSKVDIVINDLDKIAQAEFKHAMIDNIKYFDINSGSFKFDVHSKAIQRKDGFGHTDLELEEVA